MLAAIDSDLDQLVNAFVHIDEVAQHELFAASEESSLRVGADVRELTPTGATTILGRSIVTQAPQLLPAGMVTLIGTSLNYAPAVELGSKPHFPPIAPLEEWVNEVLHIDGAEARSVAFRIARKISKQGTQGAHMFKRGFEQNEARIKDNFRQAVANIIKRMATA